MISSSRTWSATGLPRLSPNRGERTEPGEAEALRVLHVEDNAADALLAQEYLRAVQPEMKFDTAVRLDEVTVGRVTSAACAILDLSLPDASGLEALIAIRAMSEALPIIVLTGVDDLDLAVAALRFGADDYLVKNDVDGDALQRAIRYSMERRRLHLELATELAATTVAAATDIAVEAALNDERQAGEQAGNVLASADPDVLLGTHEVAVRIDDETGDYALRCRSCDWTAARASDELHSWAERSLDATLLYHVDFGDLSRTHPAVPETPAPSTEVANPGYGPRMRDEQQRGSAAPAVPRRTFFSPTRWIEPHDNLDDTP